MKLAQLSLVDHARFPREVPGCLLRTGYYHLPWSLVNDKYSVAMLLQCPFHEFLYGVQTARTPGSFLGSLWY